MFIAKNKFSINVSKCKMIVLGLGLIYLVFIALSGTVSATVDTNIYVSTHGNDSWDGSLATWNGTSGPKATIKNATQTVPDKGTVYLSKGIYKENNILIIKNIKITGENQENTIIDGTNIGRMFYIEPNLNVAFTNLSFINGNVDGANGGAIYNNGGNLTITNCIFRNNSGYGYYEDKGGAIYNAANVTMSGSKLLVNDYAGTLDINYCTFTNNKATCDGGAIWNGGILKVNHSNFINNSQSSHFGGAIFNYGGSYMTWEGIPYVANEGTLSVYNSTFLNHTSGLGSVIFSDGPAEIHFNRIVGNSINAIYGSDDSTVDASLNWWGSNTYPLVNFDNSNKVIVTPWLVLTITASPNSIWNTNNSTITVDLLHDSNGNYPLNGITDGIPVNFTSNTGIVMNISEIINGTAQTTFTSISEGLATISAFVDNESIQTTITVIDTIIPIVTINLPEGIYNSIQTINLNATDTLDNNPIIYYSLDGNIWKYQKNFVNITLTEGKTSLMYYCKDSTGNQSPTQIIVYTIDIHAPLINLTNQICNPNKTFILNATDNLDFNPKIYFSLDNGITWKNQTNTVTFKLNNGKTSLIYYAVDAANNYSNLQKTIYYIDLISPTAKASIISGLYNTTKSVTLSMTEDGTIYYTLNGTTPTTASTKYTGPITISSTKILKFMAVDKAGNKSPSYTQTYTIDKTAPKVISTTPTNLKTGVNKTSTIVLKFNENIKNSTYYSNIKVKNLTTGKYVTISKAISGNTLYIKTSTTRSKYTWYQVTIPTKAVKDYAGNNLAATYTFKFKTGP